MRCSDRDPAGKPRLASAENPLGSVACPWIVSSAAVPPKARTEMRTVDPVHRVGAPRAEEIDPRFLVALASVVLGQLELAAKEKLVGETSRTRLGFFETRNDVTGEWGIVARELLTPGGYSRPLAELLATGGELTEEAKNQANWLGWNAANRRLEIVVFEELDQKRPRPAAFAATRSATVPDTFYPLARLLVTPFEISQWTDRFVEMNANSRS